jgi:hypothetical protein
VIQLLISIAILVGLWGDPSATEFFRKPDVATVPGAPPIPPPPV